MKKTNLKLISNITGYSVSTVSRALNDSNLISTETKEKIKKVAKELDYFPNINAKALSSKKTYTIGVILFRSAMQSFANPFFVDVFKGINEVASKSGYFTLNGYIEFDKQDSLLFKHAKALIMSHRIDGALILSSTYNNSFIEYLLDKKFPFVLLGKPLIDTNHWIDNNNIEASFEITKHLFEKGYKSPVFVSGSPKYTVSYDRFLGFIKAYKMYFETNKIGKEKKLKKDKKNQNENLQISFKEFVKKEIKEFNDIVYFTNFDRVEVNNIAEKIVKNKNVDSAVVIDDFTSFLLMEKLKQMRIKIPDNFGIVTFNNSFLSKISTPRLTTVETFPEILGEKITNNLLKIIDNGSYKIMNHLVKTKIIEGKSTEKKIG